MIKPASRSSWSRLQQHPEGRAGRSVCVTLGRHALRLLEAIRRVWSSRAVAPQLCQARVAVFLECRNLHHVYLVFDKPRVYRTRNRPRAEGWGTRLFQIRFPGKQTAVGAQEALHLRKGRGRSGEETRGCPAGQAREAAARRAAGVRAAEAPSAGGRAAASGVCVCWSPLRGCHWLRPSRPVFPVVPKRPVAHGSPPAAFPLTAGPSSFLLRGNLGRTSQHPAQRAVREKSVH